MFLNCLFSMIFNETLLGTVFMVFLRSPKKKHHTTDDFDFFLIKQIESIPKCVNRKVPDSDITVFPQEVTKISFFRLLSVTLYHS